MLYKEIVSHIGRDFKTFFENFYPDVKNLYTLPAREKVVF